MSDADPTPVGPASSAVPADTVRADAVPADAVPAGTVPAETVWAVVPAAGSGERLGGGRPKALVELAGRPLVSRALDALAAGGVTDAVVVVPPDPAGAAALLGVLAADPPPLRLRVATGGADRTASVAAGLAAVPDDVATVLVHDAARPLVPAAVTRRVLAALRAGAGAVVPALPVTDTVKQVLGDVVHGTVDRGALVAVQTPQGFATGLLRRAHAAARPGGATDDAGLVEALGERVVVVAGDPASLKVTRPLDLVLARAVLHHCVGSGAVLADPDGDGDGDGAGGAGEVAG